MYEEVAAKWWGNQFRYLSKSANIVVRHLFDDPINIFESILARDLKKEVEHCGYSRIVCEDTPDEIICNAARYAGLSTTIIPKQTRMFVSKNCVEVSTDPTSQYEIIYRRSY